MARKLIVEAIGTFFLMFTIGQVVLEPGAGTLAPLAIGSVLMVMVYAGGHISGAHYNPAVSLAVLLRGRATGAELGGYAIVQVASAVAGALAVQYFKSAAPVVPLALDPGPTLLAELLFTFALVFVILNVATARGTEGNSYYGLAIGFTVMGGAYAVGGISGAAFNPAVTAGLLVLGLAGPGSLWIYLIAQLSAAVAAALLFNALDLGDDKPTTATPAEQAGLQGAAETGGGAAG